MRYDIGFINPLVESVLSGKATINQIARQFNIAINTVRRWVNRKLSGLPYKFSTAAKNVWNKTKDSVASEIKSLLGQGKSSVIAWIETGEKVCLRTAQRIKAKSFPKTLQKKKCKRYERRKIFSLMHTDWGIKRILGGKRMCFSFYEDDASRKLYALKAYSKASLENTLDNLKLAAKKTKGFKAVLSDCGKVYTKTFGIECNALGIKSIHTRPYNPKCNGKAEAVVKKVKNFLGEHIVMDIEHANELLKRFEHEYNNTPHSSLNYRTPNHVFREKKNNGDIWAVA